jgi:predicted ATP-binding protein involved in virulence
MKKYMLNKTHKHSYHKNKKLSDLDRTFHSLEKWKNELFENLGWMVLAKEQGYTDKLNSYKKSIQRLKKAIDIKIEKSTDADKIEDLQIMHQMICVLEKHAEKDF